MKDTIPAKTIEPVLPFNLTLMGVRPGGLTKALHRQLRVAILERRLLVGFLLPSTRQLASRLGVGRNMVIAAYEQLVLEGYAQSRPGARLVVTHPQANAALQSGTTVGSKVIGERQRASDTRIATVWRQPAQRIVYEANLPDRCFRTGAPEHRHFDHDIWRRLTSRASRASARAPFNYRPAEGLPELREAIASHVAFVRAVVCEANDVVVTCGAQEGFDVLARLLVTPGLTRVAVEDPGYPPLRAAFVAAGARVAPVPVDNEGLQVDRIPNDVKVICVTPSHQSPTGIVMSSARRAALLDRARTLNAVIVEDDYDGEFLYDPHPHDALQTLDREQRVFYVGTFSKSLFPSLRKGFVVAPRWARDAIIDIKRIAGTHTDFVPQATLAAFIAEGHLARHIRRMRPIYAQRRHAFEQGAEHYWGNWMRVQPGNAGLHLSTSITDAAMANLIIECAGKHLPGALPLSSYSIGKTGRQGLCIGYGSIDVDQIARAVRALGAAVRSSNM